MFIYCSKKWQCSSCFAIGWTILLLSNFGTSLRRSQQSRIAEEVFWSIQFQRIWRPCLQALSWQWYFSTNVIIKLTTYVIIGNPKKLLAFSKLFPSELGKFLSGHPDISWIHQLAVQDYQKVLHYIIIIIEHFILGISSIVWLGIEGTKLSRKEESNFLLCCFLNGKCLDYL